MYTKETVYVIKFENNLYAQFEQHDHLGLCVSAVENIKEGTQCYSLEDESNILGVYSLIKEINENANKTWDTTIDDYIRLEIKEIVKIEVRTIIDVVETIKV